MSKIVSHDLNKLSDCKKYRDSVFRPIEKKKKKSLCVHLRNRHSVQSSAFSLGERLHQNGRQYFFCPTTTDLTDEWVQDLSVF